MKLFVSPVTFTLQDTLLMLGGASWLAVKTYALFIYADIIFNKTMNMSKNPWQTHSTEVIFQNPWIKLIKDEVIAPTGKPGTYTILEAKPFIIVAALQDDALLMIEQYRYPLNKPTIEFPAGGLEMGEDSLAAAQRELKDETGYEADVWEDGGELYELVSISRQPGHLFIASGLRKTDDHMMTEDGIESAKLIPIRDIEAMIKNGIIFDALTPAVLYRVMLQKDTMKK